VKYCLECHRIWPSEALICGSCRKSFGGRLCHQHHLSPPGATCCVVCGSRKLLHPAMYWNLRVPILVGSWLAGILALKFLFGNLGTILGFLFTCLDRIGSFVIGQSLASLFGTLVQLAIVLAIIWLAFRRLLGPNSLPIRGLERIASTAIRQLPQVARWVLKAVVRAVSGRPLQTRPPLRGGRE
jgi:hypothetical protein